VSEVGSITEFVGKGLAALLIAVGDRDDGTVGVKGAGSGGTEAGRPAGYEC
jgi:hypothetical protein